MKSLGSVACVVAAMGLSCCGGCYDGKLLVREAQSTALNTRLAEVDLGRFLTTLPRDRKTGSLTEVEIHLFAAVPRTRVAEVAQQLKAEDYRLRHDLLAAVRGSTADELTEPSLAQLRERVERAVNEILSDTQVKSIGFYQMALRNR